MYAVASVISWLVLIVLPETSYAAECSSSEILRRVRELCLSQEILAQNIVLQKITPDSHAKAKKVIVDEMIAVNECITIDSPDGIAMMGGQVLAETMADKSKRLEDVTDTCVTRMSAVLKFDPEARERQRRQREANWREKPPTQEALRKLGFEHRGNFRLRGADECISFAEQRFVRRMTNRYNETDIIWRVPQVVIQFDSETSGLAYNTYGGRRYLLIHIELGEVNKLGLTNTIDLGEMHCVFSSGNNVMGLQRPRS